MAKSARGRPGPASRHHHHRTTPYPLSCRHNISGNLTGKPKDWDDITCSVCMEYPHNAVLLLCSSHENGCRPYMCGTSSRYSNCLDQYKATASTKPAPPHQESPPVPPSKGGEGAELACPLCRGQVKGWTVVESTRKYLNSKKRSCTHDKCSFVGVYKELKKHVRAVHRSAKPREVDPDQEQRWRRLEQEDEMSSFISSVFGSLDSEEEDVVRRVMNMIHMLHSFGPIAFIRAFGDGVSGRDMMSLVVRLMRLNREINRVLLGDLLGGSERRRRRRVGGER